MNEARPFDRDAAAALIEPLTDIVIRAGAAILAVNRSAMKVDGKKDGSPVTEADLAADRIIGEGEAIGFRVNAAGLNARMPQSIADLLSSDQASGVDAHAVQPYYTRLLAQACGLSVTLAPDGEKVVVTAA